MRFSDQKDLLLAESCSLLAMKSNRPAKTAGVEISRDLNLHWMS